MKAVILDDDDKDNRDNNDHSSVTDALAENFSSEQLDGYICSKTKQEIEASRNLSLEVRDHGYVSGVSHLTLSRNFLPSSSST